MEGSAVSDWLGFNPTGLSKIHVVGLIDIVDNIIFVSSMVLECIFSIAINLESVSILISPFSHQTAISYLRIFIKLACLLVVGVLVSTVMQLLDRVKDVQFVPYPDHTDLMNTHSLHAIFRVIISEQFLGWFLFSNAAVDVLSLFVVIHSYSVYKRLKAASQITQSIF